MMCASAGLDRGGCGLVHRLEVGVVPSIGLPDILAMGRQNFGQLLGRQMPSSLVTNFLGHEGVDDLPSETSSGVVLHPFLLVVFPHYRGIGVQ